MVMGNLFKDESWKKTNPTKIRVEDINYYWNFEEWLLNKKFYEFMERTFQMSEEQRNKYAEENYPEFVKEYDKTKWRVK